jgi:hypothetical protein
MRKQFDLWYLPTSSMKNAAESSSPWSDSIRTRRHNRGNSGSQQWESTRDEAVTVKREPLREPARKLVAAFPRFPRKPSQE